MSPLEVFAQICAEAVRDCGTNADIATIEAAIRSRLDALSANDRAEVDAAIKALTSYEAPGFHEHGSH